MSNWIKLVERPYADDNKLLNDWIDSILFHVSWELFENQDKIVYSTAETENGIPKLKDGALEVIRDTIISELGWLRGYMMERILVSYAKSNIDLGEEGTWYVNELFEEEDVPDFWNEVYHYIWNDYSRALGEEKTQELWDKWGYPPLKKIEEEE